MFTNYGYSSPLTFFSQSYHNVSTLWAEFLPHWASSFRLLFLKLWLTMWAIKLKKCWSHLIHRCYTRMFCYNTLQALNGFNIWYFSIVFTLPLTLHNFRSSKQLAHLYIETLYQRTQGCHGYQKIKNLIKNVKT